MTRTWGEFEVVVNQGALTTLCFRIRFWLLAKQVGFLLRSNRLNPNERNDVEKGFHDAHGLANALTIQSIRDRTNLPDLRPALSQSEMNELAGTLLAAEVFLLLHETSHITLGHLDGTAIIELPREEFWVSEELLKHKECERQADQHALDILPQGRKPLVARGAFFMLELVVCHELWAKRLSSAHPLSLNRMQRIGSRPEIKGDSFAETLYSPSRLQQERAIF